MSHFKIDEIKSDFLKVFTSWDFVSYTSCRVHPNTACKHLDSELLAFHQKLSPGEGPRSYSFLFVIRDKKRKLVLFQRKLNFFECPLRVFLDFAKSFTEDGRPLEGLLLSVHVRQFYSAPESESSQIFANFQSLLNEKGAKSSLSLLFPLSKARREGVRARRGAAEAVQVPGVQEEDLRAVEAAADLLQPQGKRSLSFRPV